MLGVEDNFGAIAALGDMSTGTTSSCQDGRGFPGGPPFNPAPISYDRSPYGVPHEAGYCTTAPGMPEGQSMYHNPHQYHPQPHRVSPGLYHNQHHQQRSPETQEGFNQSQHSRHSPEHQAYVSPHPGQSPEIQSHQGMHQQPSPASHDICLNQSTELPPPPPLSPPPAKERFSYTRYQLEVLAGIYAAVRYPNAAQKRLIAKRVGITRDQVKIWFQNRRRKDVTGHPSVKSGDVKQVSGMVPDNVLAGVVAELLRYAEEAGKKAAKTKSTARPGPYTRPESGRPRGASNQGPSPAGPPVLPSHPHSEPRTPPPIIDSPPNPPTPGSQGCDIEDGRDITSSDDVTINDLNESTNSGDVRRLSAGPAGGGSVGESSPCSTAATSNMLSIPSNEQLDMVAPPNAVAPGAPPSPDGHTSAASPRCTSTPPSEDEEEKPSTSSPVMRSPPRITDVPPNVTLSVSEPLPKMDAIQSRYQHSFYNRSLYDQTHHLQDPHHGYRANTMPTTALPGGAPTVHAPIPSYPTLQPAWLADHHHHQASLMDPYLPTHKSPSEFGVSAQQTPAFGAPGPGFGPQYAGGTLPGAPPGPGLPHPAYGPEMTPLSVLPFPMVADPPLRLSSMTPPPPYGGAAYNPAFKSTPHAPRPLYRDPYQPLLISGFSNPYFGLDPSTWQQPGDRNPYSNL